MRVNVDGRVSGVVEGQDPIEVRHQLALPVLALLGVVAIIAALATTRPHERFGLVGCSRDARLCTIFDSATGELSLTPLPLYPSEAAPVSPRSKQEV